MTHGTDQNSPAQKASPPRAVKSSSRARLNLAESPKSLLEAHIMIDGVGLDPGPDALAEATRWQTRPGHDDPQLTDWRALAFVTIDNPGSRDLDQALLIEKTHAGYRVRYALADAAYYVKPGSELFAEALVRGATYYAPGLSVPMLPRLLSEGLISLNPEADRRALVFDMQLRADGEVIQTTVARALIRSLAQLTYEEVQVFLDDSAAGKPHPWSTAPYARSILLLGQLGETLMQASLDREVIPFNRRETQIQFRHTPPHWVAGVRQRYDSERYNEQISLLCNRQGALLIDALSRVPQTTASEAETVQGIYRVHDAPPDARLNALHKRLRQLAERRQLDARWQWHGRRQSLAHYVAGLPDEPSFARLRQAVEQQVMMTNVASEFRAEPGRHHALAAERYARFSSPMREIVGIFTHKELLEALGTGTPELQDIELRDRVIDAANQAKRAQKRLDKSISLAVLAQLFEQDLEADRAPQRHGTLVGLRDDRAYVSIDGLAIDVKVYLEDIQTQYSCTYRLSDIEARPDAHGAPSFVLGDGVSVQVSAYDQRRERYVLNLLATSE